MRLIERMIEQIVEQGCLAEHGSLLLEFGVGQAASVEAILKARGFAHVATRRDYGGIERVTRASQTPFTQESGGAELVIEPEPDPRELAMQAMADADEAGQDQPQEQATEVQEDPPALEE